MSLLKAVPLPRARLALGLRGTEMQPLLGTCVAEGEWEKGAGKRSQRPFILGPTCKHFLKDQ